MRARTTWGYLGRWVLGGWCALLVGCSGDASLGKDTPIPRGTINTAGTLDGDDSAVGLGAGDGSESAAGGSRGAVSEAEAEGGTGPDGSASGGSSAPQLTGGSATGGEGTDGAVTGGAGTVGPATGGVGATGGTTSGDTGGGPSTGGDTGTGGSTVVDCPALPSCNWCDGSPVVDNNGCTTGWLCANGADPCVTAACLGSDECAPDEVCRTDGLCWPGTTGEVTLTATYDGQIHTTWHNGLNESIFLYGCGTVSLWRLDGVEWVDRGQFVVCDVEGVAIEVSAGETYVDPMSEGPLSVSGTYRLSGPYGIGCSPDEALSEARCAERLEVVSNEVTITGVETGPSCEAMDAVGEGDCTTVVGVIWNGTECVTTSGCGCTGADCDTIYQDESSCEADYADCLN